MRGALPPLPRAFLWRDALCSAGRMLSKAAGASDVRVCSLATAGLVKPVTICFWLRRWHYPCILRYAVRNRNPHRILWCSDYHLCFVFKRFRIRIISKTGCIDSDVSLFPYLSSERCWNVCRLLPASVLILDSASALFVRYGNF